jgi:hypothetical protein
MRLRLKALGLHLLASATTLAIILGTLFIGWYRWPGWYLADAIRVVTIMMGVDAVLGPLCTFIVASKGKPRRVLTRDIAIIVAVQMAALIYGSTLLWNGRPLYYAYSEGVLQLVQSYDINAHQSELGRRQNPELAPHWYSLPRWIWAPLPQDPELRKKIVTGTIEGEDDVISMPIYFQTWEKGLPSLREQLKKVDKVAYFSPAEKEKLKRLMREQGFNPDELNAMPFSGRGHPLLAVFDLNNLKIKAILTPRGK